MNKSCSIKRRCPRPILPLGLLTLLFTLLAAAQVALAHPLDAYLQATYITVTPTQIGVELNLTPGVLVAPQIFPQLDPDGDQQDSDAEGRAYVEVILRDVGLQVDGKPLVLAVTKIDMPGYLNVQAGYGTIRIFTTASPTADMTGTHQLYYKNNYAPTGSDYQVNAIVDKGATVTLGKQKRDGIQQSMTMDYVIGSAGLAKVVPATTAATSTTAVTSETASLVTLFEIPAGAPRARQLLAYLYEPTRSPWVLLLVLALAGVLGGLHGLTPGHGKTLVAAYLVGSRGTVRHAVTLGAIVTFTHTASVIVIGLLALFASQFVVPNVLVPILEILSGLLVVFMGVRLIWQRWIAFRSSQNHAHGSAHDHSPHDHSPHDHSPHDHSPHDHSPHDHSPHDHSPHDHSPHDHSPHDHSHSHDHAHDHEAGAAHHHGDGHSHPHLPPLEGIKLSSLLAMGISGGLVPCPEALGIMVIAIGLNRILLGLGLIVAFSFGLAAVLIIIGILLVRSRSLLERFGGVDKRWSSALPLVSAVIVTVLGIGITFSGVATYLG